MTDALAYSIQQAAAVSGLSTDTIMKAIHRTDAQALPAKKYGAKYLVTRAALERWINALADA